VEEPDLDEDDEHDVSGYGYPLSTMSARTANSSRQQFRDALDAEPEKPQGLIGKLASAVGMAIAIPLALLVGLIGTVLPILVVVGLFMGPSDTWNMVRAWIPGSGSESAACEGFDDWYSASADRSQRILSMLPDDQFDAPADPASLRSYAAEADAMAAEQRRSTPPHRKPLS
jgi:hypothetical protein